MKDLGKDKKTPLSKELERITGISTSKRTDKEIQWFLEAINQISTPRKA